MSFFVIHMYLGNCGPETVPIICRECRLVVAMDDNFGDC